MPRRRRTTTLAAVLAIAYVAALAFFGMQPRRETPSDSTPIDLIGRLATSTLSAHWPSDVVAPFIWAVVLFVPVGALAYLTLPRWAWPISLLVGPTISVLIELMQWAIAPGQIADPVDVLCNSIGASLGVGLAALLTLFAARPRVGALPRSPLPPPPSTIDQTP